MINECFLYFFVTGKFANVIFPNLIEYLLAVQIYSN